MTSIPASQLVQVLPSVLSAGGNPLSLNAVFLTDDTSIPLSTVQPFATVAQVQAWFGAGSQEALMAGVYFSGFIGAETLPGTLYFAQYNSAAVAGYIRGASLAGLSLTALQALSGTLTLTLDGVSTVSAAISLSGATSFSDAAATIETEINAGTPTNTASVSYDANLHAFVITSSSTGASSAVGFPTTNSLSTGLGLTVAAGAVASHGAIAAVPAALMASIVNVTQNWATFTYTVEPIDSVKLQFAAWVQTTTDRYAMVAWDSATNIKTAPQAACFGVLVAAEDGICCVSDATGLVAAFICGVAGSIDFTQPAGRITFAYKSNGGLVPSVTDATTAQNLTGNGYNFYGAYATADQAFQFLQPGSVSGAWKWFDSYINQIYLNNALQLALVELLANTKSIPYSNAGYSLIRAACLDPINAALLAGVIQPGVTLAAAQIQEINTAAQSSGAATAVQQIGWYLQILAANPTVRSNRGSPPMTLWYADGGSVQKLTLASIDVQ